MHPRLKDVFWRRHGVELRLIHEAREQLRLDDRNGTLELVLDLLRTGSRTPAELARTAGAALASVDHLLDVLDRHRLLVDDCRVSRTRDGDDVHGGAGMFFAPYATLRVSGHDMVERLRAAHVLLLGVGRINLEVASQLAELGIGRLTVADARPVDHGAARLRVPMHRLFDEPTAAARVIARVTAIDPTVQIVSLGSSVSDPIDLGTVLDRQGPDIVVADLGRAASGDEWVNASCVERGVPLASAVVGQSGALVYSVDAGRTACVACMTAGAAVTQDPRAVRLASERPNPAHLIPPMYGMLGSLVALEVLRYVTGYEPPAYADHPTHVELTAGGAMTRLTWRRNSSCAVCGDAIARPLTAVGAGEPMGV
jgi:molybdopterin/thiamine biosynthesis adenylyltransferase